MNAPKTKAPPMPIRAVRCTLVNAATSQPAKLVRYLLQLQLILMSTKIYTYGRTEGSLVNSNYYYTKASSIQKHSYPTPARGVNDHTHISATNSNPTSYASCKYGISAPVLASSALPKDRKVRCNQPSLHLRDIRPFKYRCALRRLVTHR